MKPKTAPYLVLLKDLRRKNYEILEIRYYYINAIKVRECGKRLFESL